MRSRLSLGLSSWILIYAQFGLLYEILSNAPWLNFDPKFKPGSCVDGIVGSTSTKVVDQVTHQMRDLSIN